MGEGTWLSQVVGTADHRLSTNHRADDRCIVTYCGASFCISFCLPQGTVRCDDVPAACISVPILILLSTSFLLLLPAMRASPGPRRPGDLTVGSSRGPPDSTFSRKSLAVYSVQYRMGNARATNETAAPFIHSPNFVPECSDHIRCFSAAAGPALPSPPPVSPELHPHVGYSERPHGSMPQKGG